MENKYVETTEKDTSEFFDKVELSAGSGFGVCEAFTLNGKIVAIQYAMS